MAALDFAALMAHERQRRKAQKAEAQSPDVLEALDVHRPVRSLAVLDKHWAPNTLKYCNNFLSAKEAKDLEAVIRKEHGNGEWLTLPKRKLLNLGGVPHPDGMIAEELPVWVQRILLPRLQALGAFPAGISPDQVLLNEYGPGQGIDPHTDGPLFAPVVGIVSLASPALLHFLKPPASIDGTSGTRGHSWTELGTPVASVVLVPGSLLVFSDHAYTNLWHGVPDLQEEVISEHTLNYEHAGLELGSVVPRGRRLSFTIRAVQRVAVPAGHFWNDEQRAEARRRRAWWAQAVSERREINKEKPAEVGVVPTKSLKILDSTHDNSSYAISGATKAATEGDAVKQLPLDLSWIETLKLSGVRSHEPVKFNWPGE